MRHSHLIENLVKSIICTSIIMGCVLSVRYYKINKNECTNKLLLFLKSLRYFLFALVIAAIAGIVFYIGLTLFAWWLLFLAALLVFL